MGKLSKLSRNKRTETQKQRKAEQPARTIANRQRRLSKHMLMHPTDLVAKKSI